MKSVFSKKTPQVHLQRNAFDLSHSEIFSIAPGMLLPIHVQEVNPNEHFEISPANYVRTMPLNSAAFSRLKQHIEFFFVPMRTLCRQFQQFIVGTDYKISSLDTLNNYKAGLPMFDIIQFAKDLNITVSGNTVKNQFGLNVGNDILRLLDLLGYGINSVNVKSFNDSGFTRTFLVNPLRLLAYQKVYYDHYRNPLYELNNPAAYNIDNIYGQNVVSRSSDWYTLRYRNWNKDYFTCVSPSFQGADYLTDPINMTNVLTLGQNVPNNDDANYTPFTDHDFNWNGNESPSNKGMMGGLITISNVENGQVQTQFNIANLRAAYALDKLYRISIAAGDGDYGSQIKAHYGFNAVHDDWKSKFIGGCSAPIQISEVVTSATTSGSDGILGNVGDIKGKGVSLNQGKFTFDTREHGIIIGLLSVTPDADYQSSMVDRFNVKSNREDYFQPEFQDLGKQPIVSTELSLQYEKIGSGGYLFPNNIIGFTNRYMEYKTSINRVHGVFNTSGSLSAWASPRNNPLFKDPSTSTFQINRTSLKVDPRILNPIMLVEYDGSENTDPLICDCHVAVQAIRPMSVSGEPML